MTEDVDFDKLLSDIGNMVDSPRSHKPKTPQKAPSSAVSSKALVAAADAAAAPRSAAVQFPVRDCDIDDILADIGDVLSSATPPPSSAPPIARSTSAAAAAPARCSRPSLGAIDGPFDARACTKLRCIKCDFAVARFEGHEWKADVDYLFFRNNHPEAGKLKTRLKPSHSRTAYCCQCSWATASGGSPAPVARDVRWVCSQH